MTVFYTILEVAALLAVIILPLFVPEKKKTKSFNELSSLRVNEGGYLEHSASQPKNRYQVQ